MEERDRSVDREPKSLNTATEKRASGNTKNLRVNTEKA